MWEKLLQVQDRCDTVPGKVVVPLSGSGVKVSEVRRSRRSPPPGTSSSTRLRTLTLTRAAPTTIASRQEDQ